jgi:hypothetical protein
VSFDRLPNIRTPQIMNSTTFHVSSEVSYFRAGVPAFTYKRGNISLAFKEGVLDPNRRIAFGGWQVVDIYSLTWAWVVVILILYRS